MAKKKKTGTWLRALKLLLIITGTIFLILCILAFTTLPFWAYYSLGTKNSKVTQTPSTIIMLGGAGIPSGDGLIRTYYTAAYSKANPGIPIIIAMPGNLTDQKSAPRLAGSELTIRGIKEDLIQHENLGRNTREQAQKLAEGMLSGQKEKPILLVTSPEHMRRAVLAFRKCGFKEVSGLPAFEYALEADLRFDDRELKGNKVVPPIGKNLQVRYQFWNHLKYEVLVIKEYFGLTYYKLRGWI